MLAANANTKYLKRYGSPASLREFRETVPVISYEDIHPWIERLVRGEVDVLFPGRPIAYERTGGSSGGSKLIPYSGEGLGDFRRALLPWLVAVAAKHGVAGRAYLSISPATRRVEFIGDVRVGLSDGEYLGAAGAAALGQLTAVPFDVALLESIGQWRAETVRHLKAARDLELISVWSPTFLLRLLEHIPEPQATWPRLKVVSCWASGNSARSATELRALLPQAHLQPKGLLSTECVVTLPDDDDRPVLTEHGFFEFERAERLYLANELEPGESYFVVATTHSGLYRYRSGDLVRYDGHSRWGRPVLEFVGRGALVSDLVGEKLSEPFVDLCLRDVPGFRLLVPEPHGRGYVLAVESGASVSGECIERRLLENPQYAYARKLGQLEPLRVLRVEGLFDCYVDSQLRTGARLAEIKPVSLRSELTWATTFGGQP